MPAAKPAALKLLNGRGPGKDSAGRPVNEGPGFVRESPEPPSFLGVEARAEWERVVPELTRLRMLSRVTTGSLTNYCEQWEMFVNATKTLHDEGFLYMAKQGLIPHPAVNVQRQAGAEMRRWATEYGLTPASEQKVRAHEPESSDDDFN